MVMSNEETLMNFNVSQNVFPFARTRNFCYGQRTFSDLLPLLPRSKNIDDFFLNIFLRPQMFLCLHAEEKQY